MWQNCKDDLVRGRETWGMVEIGYRPPDDYDIHFSKSKAKGANKGKIKLTAFKTFVLILLISTTIRTLAVNLRRWSGLMSCLVR